MLRTLILFLTIAAAAASLPSPAPAGYGPIVNPGSPDAAILIDGIPVQVEYLQCLPAYRAGTATYWEDGSLTC